MPPAPSSTRLQVMKPAGPPLHVPVSGQPSKAHVAEQPSPLMVLPSSHVSPDSTTPFPQPCTWHVGEHPSPFVVLPSSHCSPRSRTPFPQTFAAHVVEQPSPLTAL